eukprot:snap_masked-scaffold_25-processed-gene-2.26-mRNA-1 protein AED:1.00 eAED:1.00 QI:0/0/0/0/1/1/3/0/64
MLKKNESPPASMKLHACVKKKITRDKFCYRKAKIRNCKALCELFSELYSCTSRTKAKFHLLNYN